VAVSDTCMGCGQNQSLADEVGAYIAFLDRVDRILRRRLGVDYADFDERRKALKAALCGCDVPEDH
jgi:hypothetical protein